MDTPNADGIEYTDQHLNCLLGRIHETLDQSVLPHIDLDLHHNVTYVISVGLALAMVSLGYTLRTGAARTGQEERTGDATVG